MLLVLTKILTAVVALEHVASLVLEMFLWTAPIGIASSSTRRRSSRSPPRSSPPTRDSTTASSAAGVIGGLLYPDERIGLHILTFFLLCVVIAGAYGGYSVGRKVFSPAGPPGRARARPVVDDLVGRS